MSELSRDISIDELELKCVDGDRRLAEEVHILLEQIRHAAIEDDAIHSILTAIRQRKAAFELGVTAFEVAEGKRDFGDLSRAYEEATSLSSSEGPTEQFVTDNLEELYENTVKNRGLRWRLGFLNRSLGSLRRGDFGFIFARPETGKTTFLASEISFFAEQVVGPILWFNNEEQGSKVMIRCYQAALGVTLTELMLNRKENERKFNALTKGNIRVFDSASIHRKDVERICSQLKPSLVVFDQIDKLKGFAADREDLRLGSIYIWARELAKEYCPTIGVCQADGSAEGVKWLNMDHVTNAKTSKQAEADWIVGIGKTNDPGMEYIRHFNISKNKLSGDEDSDPMMRHGRADIIIEPQIARYRDI